MLHTITHRWIAVQVRPHSEPAVSALLQQKGYETFLPICNRGASRKQTPTPVFPGYLFCLMDSANVTGLIVTTPGVIRLVGAGGRAETIPPHEMDTVRQVMESGLRVVPCGHFVPGDDVEVTDGPLRGCRGVIRSLNDQEHLIVNLTLLQRSLKVQVCSAWLRPVSNHLAHLAHGPATVGHRHDR